MPENVTRFQPIENVKKPLIRWTYIDIMPSRLPTFFHEEPKFITSQDNRTGPVTPLRCNKFRAPPAGRISLTIPDICLDTRARAAVIGRRNLKPDVLKAAREA